MIAPHRLPGRTDADAERVVERMCCVAARAPVEGCGALAAQHLALAGSHLRVRLALDAARALGAPEEAVLAWATCCELLAEGLVVHDDMQDRDMFRCGQPTVWARRGMAHAVNVGDYLLLLAVAAVEDVPVSEAVRWRLARAVAQYGGRAVRAQSLEVAQAQGRRVAWEDWEQQAVGKNAVRFALPVHGAVLLAGGSVDEARRQAEPFARLGLLDALRRDVADLYGDEGPARAGTGLRDGIVTALVVQHLEAWPEDAAWLGPILRAPGEDLDGEIVRRVGDRFRQTGTLALVVGRALELARGIRCEEGPLRPLYLELLRRIVEPFREVEADLASEGAA